MDKEQRAKAVSGLVKLVKALGLAGLSPKMYEAEVLNAAVVAQKNGTLPQEKIDLQLDILKEVMTHFNGEHGKTQPPMTLLEEGQLSQARMMVGLMGQTDGGREKLGEMPVGTLRPGTITYADLKNIHEWSGMFLNRLEGKPRPLFEVKTPDVGTMRDFEQSRFYRPGGINRPRVHLSVPAQADAVDEEIAKALADKIDGDESVSALKQPRPESFYDRLTGLINEFSIENKSNTPDFILARYVTECLGAFRNATRDREKWYGKRMVPGQVT